MTTKSIVENWARYWSTPEASEQFVAFFTDDCIYEDVAFEHIMNGKSELAQFYRQGRIAFPDFKLELQSVIDADGRVAAQWLMTGTQMGDLPGVPPTQRKITGRGVSVFELKGDKIKNCQDYYNLTALLKQLGVG
jgi:steroid delta-isomerase-like uncharacterized protein